MRVNLERLKKNIIEVGEVGKNEQGGINRLAFSPEYDVAKDMVVDLFNGQGLKVEVDGVGNVIGRREGNQNLPSIMIGSHLDTVTNGGLLDGNLGVMAALECICILNDNGITTDHPIEIVGFNAEEGSEMGGTFGSRVMVGKQDLSDKTLPDKLSSYNLTLDDLKRSIKDTSKIKAFLELHIEQGGFLHNNNLAIGVVNGIAGITRYEIKVMGEANHAGTTPMDLRKDALTMAANLIVKIEEISKNMGRPFVSTIGQLTVKPGSVNVIPGEIIMVLEMRDMEQDRIQMAINNIKAYSDTITDFKFEYKLLIEKPSVKTDAEITNAISQVCNKRSINFEIMASGAGHDAKEIAAKIPIGMIFVPSIDGKSHCPEESTSWEDIERGTQVLFDAILLLDKMI